MNTPDTCWLDGDRCPYGLPHGRFKDRPLWVCHTHQNGCRKLSYDKLDIMHFLEGQTTPLTKSLVEKLFKQEETTLSSELKAVAQEIDDPIAASVILTAVEILKKWEQSQSPAEADENKVIRKGDIFLQFHH